MKLSKLNTRSVFSIFTIFLILVLAAFLLFFGIANLNKPDEPANYLSQNTRICAMLIFSGLILIYSIFRPFSGGIILSGCSIILFVHLSPVALLMLLTAILSLIRWYSQSQKTIKSSIKTT